MMRTALYPARLAHAFPVPARSAGLFCVCATVPGSRPFPPTTRNQPSRCARAGEFDSCVARHVQGRCTTRLYERMYKILMALHVSISFECVSHRMATGAVDGRVASHVLGGLLLCRQDGGWGHVRRACPHQLQELAAGRELLRLQHPCHNSAVTNLRAPGRHFGEAEGHGAQQKRLRQQTQGSIDQPGEGLQPRGRRGRRVLPCRPVLLSDSVGFFAGGGEAHERFDPVRVRRATDQEKSRAQGQASRFIRTGRSSSCCAPRRPAAPCWIWLRLGSG
jgi:hypothetical protein